MKKLLLIGFAAILMTSCGGSKRDDRASTDNYAAMLSDSIASTQKEIDSCEVVIKNLNEQTETSLQDFTTVSKAKEVGSYMIYTPMSGKYPLTGTGIMARINDTGQFELIAALSKGNFDQIEVCVGNEKLSSAIVPNDQALNYRTESLTTVSFTGEKTDSIGRLIAENGAEQIKINYLSNRTVGSWTMPEKYKKMVTATWHLYDASSRANKLEHRVSMLHQKINILREHQER